MDPRQIDRFQVTRLAGLVAGIAIGAVMGPLVLGLLGYRHIEIAAVFGCILGGGIAYLIVSGFVYMRKRQLDSDIAATADRLRAQAGLPDTIRIDVRDAHVTLDGEVFSEAQRLEMERAIASIREVRGITNRLRFAPPAAA